MGYPPVEAARRFANLEQAGPSLGPLCVPGPSAARGKIGWAAGGGRRTQRTHARQGLLFREHPCREAQAAARERSLRGLCGLRAFGASGWPRPAWW